MVVMVVETGAHHYRQVQLHCQSCLKWSKVSMGAV